jgi:hypothetical protein
VGGEAMQFVTVQLTALKREECGSPKGFNCDLTVNGQGVKHGKKLTTRQTNCRFTITDITVFDQLKRINHDFLFLQRVYIVYQTNL